jgi:hypothetical protein
LLLGLLLLLLRGGLGVAHAEPAGKKPEAPAQPTAHPAPQPAPQKIRSYTFGGLDIDGRLKTPQLLYFLNRMKSEFDTTTPDKRSFLPELKRSTDEM